jgi:hypothetical protein
MRPSQPNWCCLAPNCRPPRALAVAAIALAGLSLFGCGDGGSDEPAAAASPGAPSAAATAPTATSSAATSSAKPGSSASASSHQTIVNHAPTISGNPQRWVTGGTSYTFTPSATDADGDLLTFQIAGLPAWASFDKYTGRLAGTPTYNDLGTSVPVTITVTDGEARSTLVSFTIEVLGTATGSASLVWAAPTENEDGTPLVDLQGYKLYWGTSEGDYPNSVTLMNPGLTRYVVADLVPAEWHFVITALNSNGIESEHSNLAIEEVF